MANKVKTLAAIIIVTGLCVFIALGSQKTKVKCNEKKIRIAMCQIIAINGDREGNFVRIENAVRKAQAQKADIACFHETALLGWVNPDAHERAFPIPGKDSDRLCSIAKTYEIHLMVGLAEKQGDKLYDSILLIDDTGNILLKHRKINILTDLMTPPYSRGESVQAVNTQYGRIGLLVCADTFNDDCLSRMKEQKPDVLLVPYGWAAAEENWPKHGESLEKTVSRAAQTVGCPLIGVNLVGAITHGPWTGMIFGGQSIASNEEGIIMGRCADRDQDLEIVSIDSKYPIKHNMR